MCPLEFRNPDLSIIPLKSLEGHTIMFGTTGSGKTRAYEVMVTQAIHRGDTVIMLDPKGDKDLRERMEMECERAGRKDAFLFFHPAFPKSSIRFDPMRNFTRTTVVPRGLRRCCRHSRVALIASLRLRSGR